jgi:tellurite resistance-related uncharacterized protein
MVLLVFGCAKKQETVNAPDHKAVVQKLEGDASILRNEQKIVISEGFSLELSDVVITGPQAWVDIEIIDKGVIRVRERSRFIIKSLAASKISSKVEQGKIITSLKKLSKNEEFTVETPTVIAGVRGTSFMVSAEESYAKISVLTGNVAVTKDKNTVSIPELKEVKIEQEFSEQKVIRGSSLYDIKDIVKIANIEKTGELADIKLNLQKLDLIDQKNINDDIEINKILKSKSITDDIKDTTEEIKSRKGTDIKEKRPDTDKDLQITE